jgi:hypothetical protein
MAKRYHGMVKDGAYTGVTDRRETERRDASMMPDADNEFACVPQEIIHKKWNESDGYMLESNINDTITGIDEQRSHNRSQIGKGYKPQK